MGTQDWTAPIQPTPAYDATALANSASLTDVSPVPQVRIPAGTIQDGDTIRVYAAGKFSNTATPTLLLGVYWGGVAGIKLAATGAITTITGATNWPFRVEALITCRETGTAGSLLATGVVWMPASLTQFQATYPIDAAAAAAVAVDTTTDKNLTLGAQWGAASASNTLTVMQWAVEGLGI